MSLEDLSLMGTTEGVDRAMNTTKPSVEEQMNGIGQWVHMAILILGLITNPLSLYILSKRRIGSDTTRIILMFLAVADIGCLLTNLFISVVPITDPFWFQVMFSDVSCAAADVIQQATLTCSPWYIVLVTIERTTVVYYPLRAKTLYTRKRTLIVCFLLPVFWILVYMWCIANVVVYEQDSGVMYCKARPGKETQFNYSFLVWVFLYLYIPAAILLGLNIAIIVRLRHVRRLHKILTRSQPPSFKMTSVQQDEANFSASVTVRGDESSHAPSEDTSSVESSATSLIAHSMNSRTNLQPTEGSSCDNKFSIRKATRLVLSASLLFLVLMIPRGISYTYAVFFSDKDPNHSANDLHEVLDMVSWWLQYLNHSLNLFVYVLANKNFRFTSKQRK